MFEDDRSNGKRLKEDISNVAGEKAKEYPSFWIPQLNPTVEVKIEKPVSSILQYIILLIANVNKRRNIWKGGKVA